MTQKALRAASRCVSKYGYKCNIFVVLYQGFPIQTISDNTSLQ